jgi:hypothetical protein
VEVGTETLQIDAKVAEEPERSRLYNEMVEMLPGFDGYRHKTERVIPVIVLTLVDKHREAAYSGFSLQSRLREIVMGFSPGGLKTKTIS